MTGERHADDSHLPDHSPALTVAEIPAPGSEPSPPPPLDQLLEDFCRRRQQGEPITIRDYLQRYPALAGDPELLANLVFQDFLLREDARESPAFEDYLREYPDLADRLQRLFDADRFAFASLIVPRTQRTLARPEPFGDYDLLEILGRGGRGVVYKAFQRSLKRLVALKMPLTGKLSSPDDSERFQREAEAAARLHHPNIVAVHEVGTHDGQPYFSMDYVEGRSLAALVKDNLVKIPEAVAYVQTLATAVHYAHQQGILHRDLKPANVLVDQNGQPRITDFGMARRLDDSAQLTASGVVLGTPSYMPPEQAAGRRQQVGPASDVYSLGALLYDLLAGRPPFRGETPLDTLHQVQNDEPVSPRVLNSKVPRDLETICLKCLQKEPAQRYPTAHALAEDLKRFVAGKPITARPVSLPGRAWRWCRRNRLVASLLASLLLVFLAGFAGVIWQWQRAEERATAARNEALRADDNFAMALEAVDDYSDRVSKDPRLKEHDLEDLRKSLSQSAVKFYRRFVQQHGEDVKVQAGQVRALGRLAFLVDETESPAAALPIFQQALDLAGQIVSANPSVDEYRNLQAQVYQNLGMAYFQVRQLDKAKDAFEKTREIWAEMAQKYPSQPGYPNALAMIFTNLRGVYDEMNRPAQAEQAYQKAIAYAAPLVRDHSDVAEYKSHLAMALNNLGTVYEDQHRWQETKEVYQQALLISKDLVRDHSSAEHEAELARIYRNFGKLYRDTQRLDGAINSFFQEAVLIQDRLAQAHPTVTKYQTALAETLGNLGATYRAQQNGVEQAQRTCQRALALWERLVATHPDGTEFRIGKGGAVCNLANVERQKADHATNIKKKRNHLQAALNLYEQALQILQPVAQVRPNGLSYQQNTLYNRARTLNDLGRYNEADASFQQSIHLATPATRDQFVWNFACFLTDKGAHQRGAALAEQIAKGAEQGGMKFYGAKFYGAAWIYARSCAGAQKDEQLPPAQRKQLAEQYAARAVALLTQAHAVGLGPGADLLDRLRTNTDLDPLRSRPDFQKLVNELKKSAKP